jgi:hypothetical protein
MASTIASLASTSLNLIGGTWRAGENLVLGSDAAKQRREDHEKQRKARTLPKYIHDRSKPISDILEAQKHLYTWAVHTPMQHALHQCIEHVKTLRVAACDIPINAWHVQGWDDFAGGQEWIIVLTTSAYFTYVFCGNMLKIEQR